MENGHNEKLLEVLQILKEQISQEHWIEIANTISCKIELYLEIFLHLPTIYFSPTVRMLIFLIVYSISRKYEKNDKILALCNMIFSGNFISLKHMFDFFNFLITIYMQKFLMKIYNKNNFLDLLEKIGIDVFQYIEPKILVNQLSQNKAFSKACEFSLRNVKTYATLKSLVKTCVQNKEAMCIVLECMEVVKPKLATEQKAIFRKAEKKLAKAILKVLPEDINNAFDVKCLTAVLKVTFHTGKITDDLKRLTELTLKNIFTVNNGKNYIFLYV